MTISIYSTLAIGLCFFFMVALTYKVGGSKGALFVLPWNLIGTYCLIFAFATPVNAEKTTSAPAATGKGAAEATDAQYRSVTRAAATDETTRALARMAMANGVLTADEYDAIETDWQHRHAAAPQNTSASARAALAHQLAD